MHGPTLGGRFRAAMQDSLGARIVTLFLGLLLLVQLASFGAMSWGLGNHARGTLPGRLHQGERVLQSLLEKRLDLLNGAASASAKDFGLIDTVLTKHGDTIDSALQNQGKRVQASTVAWLDADFTMQGYAGEPASRPSVEAAARRLRLLGADGGSGYAVIGGQPHQVALVPVKAPVLLGWLLLGVAVDAGLGAEMQSLSPLDVTLLVRDAPAAPWQAALSTMSRDHARVLAEQDLPVPMAGAPEPDASPSVSLSGEEIGVRKVWLLRPGDVDGSAVLAVVSLSVDAATRTPAEISQGLAAITLLGFGIFALGSLVTARRVTTPLRRLTAAAERLGQGDYGTPLHGQAGTDEIGQLAQTFEEMRVNVADKQRQILQLAYWDPLTGLPNRVQFRDAVRDAVAQSQGSGQTLAVLMLDLDRFKHVNDVLGYRYGDLLLKSVAQRLSQQVVRGNDLVARLGGDEFAVLLRDGDAALAGQVAQRITRAFDEPLTLEEHKVDMGAGIGMACWPLHAADADTLLSHAEVAMYAAKRRTSGPLLYDASIDAGSAQTLSLLSELRQAVEQGELRVYLQPKLALDDGRVVGAEALVRWQHPKRGLVPPMQFIPFAEQTGFIRTLTIWVFEAAAREWQALHAEDSGLVLSVNLSTRDLLDLDLPAKFEALLRKHGVPASAFCLEITESAVMDDPERAMGTLNRLSALGFKLSIDDFGTGYSSLAYLKRLPVNELKIDKSFVMGMEKDPDDAKIVRSTIDLAHNMGLTVVAEGVENAQVWALLRELNCDQAQGYHMGKPMPADQFQAWAQGWVARQRPAVTVNAALLH